MKGLLLEFIFLTLMADIFFFGMVWPWIKRRITKHQEFDIEGARASRKHVITFWNDHGTGRGDDASGWRCSCGVFHIGRSGIDDHLDFIKKIDQANKELSVSGGICTDPSASD